MSDQFIYGIQPDNRLSWFKHLGAANGSFSWLGPNDVGFGWSFKHVFGGGDGIIYAIENVVEATTANGHFVPASGGRLLWFRHTGQPDGTFRWEGPKTVGTGWGGLQHVFYGGNGIIYAVEPFVAGHLQANFSQPAGPGHSGNTFIPDSGGHLLWYRHLGREDGSFRWEGAKIVGNRWDGFERLFAGGNGIIYGIERFVAGHFAISSTHSANPLKSGNNFIPASGGKLRWYRHLGMQNGSFKWEGPKIVGSGWSGFLHAFSGGDGIIYLVEPFVEARINITGKGTPASGGHLRWYHHLGINDGTFKWEGPKPVGNGWHGMKELFTGNIGVTRIPVPAPERFCGFPDPPRGAGIHTNAYTLKDRPRKLSLTWTTAASLPNVNLQQVITRAFAVWSNAVPALKFTFVNKMPADIQITVQSFPGTSKIGNTLGDGSQIAFDTVTNWAASNPLPAGTTSLLAVAIHEIGHAIGLLHNISDATVMSPFNRNNETLFTEDINAARALYSWQPQRQLTDRGSDCGPALCACAGVMAMAWKGIGADDQIYYSTSTDGINWTAQKPIPGIGTSDSPSLAWDGTRLWMAWTGVPGDTSLYYATTTNPFAWPDNPGIHIDGVGSSNGPSIAMVPGPMLTWKGIGKQSDVFFSTYNFNSRHWEPQQHIDRIGSSDRPALIADAGGGLPLMVWKGIEGDSNLFAANKTNFWNDQQMVYWNIPGNGGAGIIDTRSPGSSCGPGITSDGFRVFLAWRGAGDDSGIWFTQRALDQIGGENFVEWSSQGKVPGVGTSHRPAVAIFGDTLYMAWKGIKGDTGIWMTRLGFSTDFNH